MSRLPAAIAIAAIWLAVGYTAHAAPAHLNDAFGSATLATLLVAFFV